MRILKSLFVLLFLITLTSPVNATTDISINSNIEGMIESFVYTFDDVVIDATFLRNLKDVNGNESFGLYVFDTGGYAVVSINNQLISELVVSANDTRFIGDSSYYLGPGYIVNDVEYQNIMTNQIAISYFRTLDNGLNGTYESTHELLSEENPNFIYSNTIKNTRMSVITSKPSIIVGGTEIGIADSRMTEFTKVEWQNNNTGGKDYLYMGQGICGTISTAVALTYIDKYKNTNVIVNSPYTFPSYNYAVWLIMKLKNVIEPPLPGSFASDIINGITWFYSTSNSNITGTTLAPISSTSESTYKSSISTGYPIIMYLDVINQDLSPYGLHWVTAYRYVDYNGALWFKAADNWGNLAWINRNWIGNVVYFNH